MRRRAFSFPLRLGAALVIAMCSRSASAQVETAPDLTEAPVTTGVPAQPPEATPPQPTERYWYGYQTLIADGASVTTMLLGAATDSPAIGLIGFGGLYVAAPVVHFAHGRVGMGFASGGTRIGLTGLGAVVGYAAAGSCRESANDTSFFGSCFLHGWAEAAVGALVGLSAAAALDAAVYARGERPVARPEPSVARITSVFPSFDPRTRAATVGVGGTF